MKSKMSALIQAIIQVYRFTDLYQREVQTFGWSYLAMLLFIGIPALIIWLTRRSWTEYGVSTARWPTNLDIG